MSFLFNDVFEKMMTEANTDKVVLLAHRNPDGDAAGCVLGLSHYISTVYPQYKIYPYLSEKLDKGPKMTASEDPVFDPFEFPQEEGYAVIVCDTATRERIVGRELYEQAVCSLVLDHHAGNEGYGDVNYTQESESCAANLYHVLDWDRYKKSEYGDFTASQPHPNAADYLYMGILHDTERFNRANGDILQAAGNLIQLGADHKFVMRTMYTETLADLKRRSQIIDFSKRALDGKVAYVFLTGECCRQYGFVYEDIHPISGFLRDCEDVELGFSVFEEEPNLWRCSFRSDGKWIDVNQLLQPFGGGGHAGAAGLRKQSEDPEGLIAAILESVREMTGCVE